MNDEFYIQRCIELALKGFGFVAPNPMVGAIIVYNDQIIGEGFHQIYGQSHAEVNAVNSVVDKSLLKESTIYVSLEPCSHFGKTPPCSDLLIHHQFKRVVIGCIDTFSEVSGKGIEKLKNAGIEVKIGVLEKECRALNKRFFTFHEKKRPYVILKWAQTQDGFIDKERTNDSTGINWITQTKTKTLVHQWRAEESSILIGKNTAIIDNPSLTVREFEGKNPIRIVLDSHLEIPNNAAVFSNDAPTIIFNTIQSKEENNLKWLKVDHISPEIILNQLFKLNIQSTIIEGGKKILDSFIDANLWDEARILIGTENFSKGLIAPKLTNQPTNTFKYGEDTVLIIENS